MNWVGGARRRLQKKSDKRTQQQYFEEKRQEKKLSQHYNGGNEDEKKPNGLSQDLLFFQTVVNTHQSNKRQGPISLINSNVEKNAFVSSTVHQQPRLNSNNVQHHIRTPQHCDFNITNSSNRRRMVNINEDDDDDNDDDAKKSKISKLDQEEEEEIFLQPKQTNFVPKDFDELSFAKGNEEFGGQGVKDDHFSTVRNKFKTPLRIRPIGIKGCVGVDENPYKENQNDFRTPLIPKMKEGKIVEKQQDVKSVTTEEIRGKERTENVTENPQSFENDMVDEATKVIEEIRPPPCKEIVIQENKRRRELFLNLCRKFDKEGGNCL